MRKTSQIICEDCNKYKAEAELWKALAGELVDFLDDSEFQADRYLSYETQKVEKLLAKARAIFDDSKQREAGL